MAGPTATAPPSTAWRQALAAWLRAHQTYPDAARQRGIEGTVGLRFTLDRTGRVIELAVSRGSGSPVLDAAAAAMLRDAELPPPDPPQDRITISVQLRYALTDR
jgi:protein TonB